MSHGVIAPIIIFKRVATKESTCSLTPSKERGEDDISAGSLPESDRAGSDEGARSWGGHLQTFFEKPL